jgi:hypothetical protein
MEIEEHFYSDDPAVGHPDVRTRLPDTDYFFLGNGYIQAAVQVCRSGEGTPVGLLIMHPGELGPKRAALTCDRDSGLDKTIVGMRVGDVLLRPDPTLVHVEWVSTAGIPEVRIGWEAGPLTVVERFFCPDRTEPRLARQIEISLAGRPTDRPVLRTELAEHEELELDVGGDSEATAAVVYEVVRRDDTYVVKARWERDFEAGVEATQYWDSLTGCRSNDRDLDHLFSAARSQLPAAVDRSGRMDGSIWQYNLEWVRDQAHVAEGLVRLGDYEKARTMLARLVDEFVSSDGDTVDSGRRRPASDVELDQNGELLTALRTYVDWTGDLELVESRWSKVQTLATFPLQERFRHRPSGLLHNQREYWERHAAHGIEDGFELAHQFFVTLGLESAAYLADALGHTEDRDEWTEAAAGLRHTMLEDPAHSLIEDGHFIKRRGVDGAWQRLIEMTSGDGLPEAIPLLQDIPHFLDPDTSCVLPVAHEFIDPKGELAKNTLARMEELWNQWWEGGGYGRYHASSEPDSPGAWPFASLFVARAYIEAGDDAKAWRVLRWLAASPGGVAGTWFENDGPRIAPPYPQVGIPPWTWAELITLYVHHLLGVRPDLHGVTIRPHLLDGLDGMEASLRVREHRLKLSVRRAGSVEERGGQMGAERLPWRQDGVRVPLPDSDIAIEILC